jgi:hypothetical protein
MSYPVGTRVRLVDDVDIYPHGIIPAGSMGIVTDLNPDDDEGSVLMDEKFDFLNEWDNHLYLCDPEVGSNDWSLVEVI